MSSPAALPQARNETAASSRGLFAAAGWKLVRLLYAHLDLLTAALLALIVLFLYRHFPLPKDVANFYFLDESWHFDILAKAQHNIWLGKDVLFTYGPLTQLLFAPIFWTRDLSLGEVDKLWHFAPVWATILLVYGTARFLLPHVEPWKRALYLLLLVTFWAPFDIKLCVPLFVFAVFLWMQENLPVSTLRTTVYALTSALLITLAFLIAADAGFYSLMAFLLIAGSYGTYRFLSRQLWSPGVVFSSLTLFVFFLCMLMVNALFGAVGDFRYWISNYLLVSDYRWFEPMPMEHETTSMFAIAAFLCFSVFLWTGIVSRRSPENRNLAPRVLAVTLLSLLVMQSCIVRSSWRNVTLGLFPVIAFALAFLLGPLPRKQAGSSAGIPALLALACTAIFAASPYEAFSPKKIWQAWKAPAAAPTCVQQKLLLDQECLSPDDFLQLDAASRFLRERVAVSQSAMIYPFENVYGDLARRQVAGGVLQSYVVADPFLLDQHLGGLERAHPLWAIYSADGLAGGQVDGVPNFTRTPEVWLYLHRHFHRVANLELGVLGLQRDEDRIRRWNLEAAKWPVSPTLQRVEEGRSIRLVQLNSWPQDVDFLKLHIRVHYPFWWRVLKPASMTFLLQRADGTVKVARAIAHPNHNYELWIYPWNDIQLMNYFFENPSDWRKRGARPPITDISVRFDRRDWASVLPTEVELQSIDVVRVSLR